MNIVRTEHMRARSRGPTVVEPRRMRALVVSALVVSALFFELGHATRSTHPAAQASFHPQVLQGAFVSAGLPDGLAAAAPIPSLASFRANPRPHRSQPHQTGVVPAPPVAAPEASAPAASAPA